MALLMLKTHDLTWQDHTVNVEVMLSPSKSTLLSNKHKALASKCDNVKRNYEKERDAVLKDIMIEKRLMERKRQEILRRRSEINLKKLSRESSAISSVGSESRLSKRIASAPSTSGASSVTGSDHQSGSFFITEFKSHSSAHAPPYQPESEDQSGRISAYSDANSLASTNISTRGSFLRSPYFSIPSVSTKFDSKGGDTKRTSKLPPKSVRFEESAIGDQSERELFTRINGMTLNDRIKTFNKAQEEFNNRPVIINRLNRPKSEPVRNSQPLVAKRYRSLRLDTEEIEKAFDNFCERKNVDELHKLMKLASKLKANVRLARNTSLMPSMAALKAAKMFKKNIKSA
ncbi:hypothetical protein FSP39_025287 [Pinctada imbricata]|uniref:Uncharacterized protein n=1 Tax=Pinctada imbricata TaxID=66713 RepID=A0AA88XUT0_PINIB|nr:hypothetical protein FSP39_025287 [Pinctada imbricata]